MKAIGALRRGGLQLATYDLTSWTVILGEVVVNCLVEIGIRMGLIVGVPRRAREAGRSSLEFIGKQRGVDDSAKCVFIRTFQRLRQVRKRWMWMM